jgi:hypothetical protein
MRFHFRRNVRLWPFRVTLTEKGLTWGVRAGRYGYDPKTGKHSFNTPGLGYVRSSGRRRRTATSQRRSPILGLLGLLAVFAVGYLGWIGALPWL